jgi:predicted ATPase
VVGWCAATNGDLERGTALAAEAVATMQAIHSRHFLPYLLGLLADVHSIAGNEGEALKAIQDGLAVAESTGEHFYDAELLRLRGKILAHSPGQQSDSEAAFQAAIKIAQQQGAAALLGKINESMRVANRSP